MAKLLVNGEDMPCSWVVDEVLNTMQASYSNLEKYENEGDGFGLIKYTEHTIMVLFRVLFADDCYDIGYGSISIYTEYLS